MGMLTHNQIATAIVDAAVAVHRELGPGLLESVYEAVLAYELKQRGLHTECQVPLAISYKGMRFEGAFRADIVVENRVIIEVKSVAALSRAHHKQLQTYLRLTDTRLGFILNFGAALMKEGIVRAVNGLEE